MTSCEFAMTSCEFATVRLHGRLLALRSGRGRPSTMPTTPSPAVGNKKPGATSARCASSRRDDAEELSCNDSGGGGRLVDEGMVVLRRRIHEMEAAERGCREIPLESDDATYDYDADVCQLLGVLQAFLINSRPGVAVGLVAVLLLAVPISTAFLVKFFVDASRAIMSNLQHHL